MTSRNYRAEITVLNVGQFAGSDVGNVPKRPAVGSVDTPRIASYCPLTWPIPQSTNFLDGGGTQLFPRG
jgi:hypothetical protein